MPLLVVVASLPALVRAAPEAVPTGAAALAGDSGPLAGPTFAPSARPRFVMQVGYEW